MSKSARSRRTQSRNTSQRLVGMRQTLPKIQQGSSAPDHNFDHLIDDVVNRLLATRFSPGLPLPPIDSDQSTLSSELELPTTAPESAIIVLLLPGNTKTEYKHMEDGKLRLCLCV